MSPAKKIERLFSTLDAVVEEAMTYFQGLDIASSRRNAEWGPREVLSHFLYWHDATSEGMERATKGHGSRVLDTSADELNAEVVAQHAGEGLLELVAHARKAHERLVQAAFQMSNLDTVVIHSADGLPVTARQRLKRIVRHWQDHLDELQA